jgi:YD repeat-containing protein
MQQKMKTSLLFFIFGFIASISLAQTTTLKQGIWSDPKTWTNSSLPGLKDDVVLQHDITIDANGFCKSLKTNGHKVTVNSGVHLSIGANPWDSSLLVSIINIYYSQDGPIDSTFRTIKNSYVDGEKRILIAEINLTERTDTFYTLFTYNKLDQLTSITDYASDEQFGCL